MIMTWAAVGKWGPSFLASLTFPVLVLTATLVSAQEARCGVVFCVMAVLWITEVVPLAVTALIPVFALPLLGVLPTSAVCQAYFKDTNVMFLGGLMMAVAVEHSNLHKRIALIVILRVGQSPRLLMAGFMVTVGFLSMWISNTAATAMIVPIVDAIVLELAQMKVLEEKQRAHQKGEKKGVGCTSDGVIDGGEKVRGQQPGHQEVPLSHFVNDTSDVVVQQGTPDELLKLQLSNIPRLSDQDDKQRKEEEPEIKALRQMFLLSVAFAANIGGTGSPLGCGPNIVLMGLLQNTFREPTGLNFATWMGYNVPGMVVCGVLGWLWLQVLHVYLRKPRVMLTATQAKNAAVKRFLEGQYRAMGRLSRREGVVLASFAVLITLWVFRAPGFVTGWSKLVKDTFGEDMLVRSATPVMLMVFVLFCIPAGPEHRRGTRVEGCLTWKVLEERVPWGMILLLGGGLAMAEAARVSGLSLYLGLQLQGLQSLSREMVVLVVTCMAASFTELTSNTATASVLLPILKDLALAININPLYLLIPATTSCAFAFMLPVATPGNTIVLAAARMTTQEMMKAGFVMNVLCVLVVNVMINTLGVHMFDLNTFPSWVNSTTTIP